MIAAGIGIPIMAALNSGLGVRLGNPVAASNILPGMALVVSLVFTLSRPLPEASLLSATPLFYGQSFRRLLHPIHHMDCTKDWHRQCDIFRASRPNCHLCPNRPFWMVRHTSINSLYPSWARYRDHGCRRLFGAQADDTLISGSGSVGERGDSRSSHALFNARHKREQRVVSRAA